MTAPNLVSPTTVTGKTALVSAGTTLVDVLSNASGSNKVLKINTIRAANVSASAVTVDVAIYRAGVIVCYLLKNGSVDAAKTLVINDKNEYIYLEENDYLRVKASASSSIDITINYEEIV